MEPLNMAGCGCNKEQETPNGSSAGLGRALFLAAVGLGLWYLLYSRLLPFSRFFTFRILGLTPESHLGEAIQFFVYDTPKVFLLLVLVVFGMGVVRSFFTAERTRRILASRQRLVANTRTHSSI